MTTGPEHYREAERLLKKAEGQDLELAQYTVAAAQAHATLALAAAEALRPSGPDWSEWVDAAGQS